MSETTKLVVVRSGKAYSFAFGKFLETHAQRISTIVLDEVHTVVTEKDYRPKLQKIKDLTSYLSESQFIGLTGTLSSKSENDIRALFGGTGITNIQVTRYACMLLENFLIKVNLLQVSFTKDGYFL